MNVRRLIVTPGIVAVAAVLLAVSAIMDAAGGQNGQDIAPAPQNSGARHTDASAAVCVHRSICRPAR
jgi:hypothetical protein